LRNPLEMRLPKKNGASNTRICGEIDGFVDSLFLGWCTYPGPIPHAIRASRGVYSSPKASATAS
jgi:hypothetical protein